MSKPEDIAQDVWDRAGCALLSPHHHEAVARAIMAAKAEEREACAGYHDDLVAQHTAFAEGSPIEAAKHHTVMARRHAHYAAAIRKRGDV